MGKRTAGVADAQDLIGNPDVIGFTNDGIPVLKPSELRKAVMVGGNLKVLDLNDELKACYSSPDGQTHVIEKWGVAILYENESVKIIEPSRIPSSILDVIPIEPRQKAVSAIELFETQGPELVHEEQPSLDEIEFIREEFSKSTNLKELSEKTGLTLIFLLSTPPVVEFIRSQAKCQIQQNVANALKVDRSQVSDAARRHGIEFPHRGRNFRKSPTIPRTRNSQ